MEVAVESLEVTDPLVCAANRFGLMEFAFGIDGEAIVWWVPQNVDWNSLPAQGFKIHLSATIGSAAALLQVVLPYLHRKGRCFKYIRDIPSLQKLNCGWFGYSQVGKFITIYPDSAEDALALTRDLHELVKEFRGPSIVSDRRITPQSIIHYRYGAFQQKETIQDPSGRAVPDTRKPADAVPEWIVDSLRAFWGAAGHSCSRDELFKRYLIVSVLSQRPKGGVYLAMAFPTCAESGYREWVVIKEGRRYGESEASGLDGYQRVAREWGFFQILKGNQAVPRAVEYVASASSSLLVLERLQGRTLKEILLEQETLPASEIGRLIQRIFAGLSSIRARGVIFFDLSPGNIFVCSSGEIKLLDFEHALYESDIGEADWDFGTPGFFPSSELLNGISDDPEERLWYRYAYGLTALAVILSFPQIYQRILDQAVGPVDLPALMEEGVGKGASYEFLKRGCMIGEQFASFDDFVQAMDRLSQDDSHSRMVKDESSTSN